MVGLFGAGYPACRSIRERLKDGVDVVLVDESFFEDFELKDTNRTKNWVCPAEMWALKALDD